MTEPMTMLWRGTLYVEAPGTCSDCEAKDEEDDESCVIADPEMPLCPLGAVTCWKKDCAQ